MVFCIDVDFFNLNLTDFAFQFVFFLYNHLLCINLDNIILPGGICKEDLRRFLLHAGKTYGWSALVDTAHAVVSGGSMIRS
jgi:hypothetical protein